MSKHIKQLRYYGPNNENNYPQNVEEGYIGINQLINEKFFAQYMPITQIGIQTMPGTKFYLNDMQRNYPIIIGYTGIYELKLDGIAEINSLAFDGESISRIANTSDAYLIIDMVYESGE